VARVQDRERDFFGTDYHRGDYVFTFEDGRPPHPDTIRQRFDRLAAAAGLSPDHLPRLCRPARYADLAWKCLQTGVIAVSGSA